MTHQSNFLIHKLQINYGLTVSRYIIITSCFTSKNPSYLHTFGTEIQKHTQSHSQPFWKNTKE